MAISKTSTVNIEDAARVLNGHKIAHPMLVTATKEMNAACGYGSAGTVSLLIGPKGVGKTTALEKLLINSSEVFPNAPSNQLPLVRVKVHPPESGETSMKDAYFSILHVLNQPFALALQSNVLRPHVPSYSHPSPVLRQGLAAAIELRQTKMLLLDDADNFAGQNSEALKLSEQLGRVSALAKQTGIQCVVALRYDNYRLVQQIAPTLGDFQLIHFPRYNWVAPEQQSQFVKVLEGFDSRLRALAEANNGPGKPAFNFELKGEAELWYRGCCGCVGLLKNWLLKALLSAQARGNEYVTLDLLREKQLPTGTLKHLAQEIRSGEELFLNSKTDTEELDGIFCGGQEPTAGLSKPAKTKPRPFERNPTRDPCGVPDASSIL